MWHPVIFPVRDFALGLIYRSPCPEIKSERAQDFASQASPLSLPSPSPGVQRLKEVYMKTSERLGNALFQLLLGTEVVLGQGTEIAGSVGTCGNSCYWSSSQKHWYTGARFPCSCLLTPVWTRIQKSVKSRAESLCAVHGSFSSQSQCALRGRSPHQETRFQLLPVLLAELLCSFGHISLPFLCPVASDLFSDEAEACFFPPFICLVPLPKLGPGGFYWPGVRDCISVSACNKGQAWV